MIGWGEFPVRVQLHLKDSRNRKIDIIHHLKLDRSYTGEQTLGAETHVDVEIESDLPVDVKPPHVQNENQNVSTLVDDRLPSRFQSVCEKTNPYSTYITVYSMVRRKRNFC